jgi:putative sterol carrier protein
MSSLDELFERMPGDFNPDKANGINATIQFNLTGEGGGQYYVNVYDGMAETGKGTANDPAMTIHMGAAEFKNMMNGQLSAMQAYMNGTMKIDGSLTLGMQFLKFFNLA